jgi:hypothetical protein
MPNEQTSVPLFTAGEVLTAANMNISAGTGVPVFTNTTTRDAAFGGAGEKVLAEGQLCYLSDSNIVQYYSGASWATVGPASSGALVRVGGGTLSGSSTAFANVFSATYEAYKIIITGGTLSTTAYVKMILGATTSGYLSAQPGSNFSTGAFSTGLQNSGTGFFVGYAAGEFGSDITIVSPQLARYTHTSSSLGFVDGNVGASHNGVLENTTQYTGFTLSATGGTFTGTVNIYGYALS